MPLSEKDVRWVEPPTLGLMDMLYIPAITQGLVTTMQRIVRPKITREFPEQRMTGEGGYLPPFYRGVHRLNRDEKDRVKCVACYMCSTACPAHCIDIVAAPAPEEWQKDGREKYPETFVIDELRCIYCGMCEQACPVDAIELTTLADLTGLSREQMMFDKEKLLSVYDQTVKMGTDPVRTRGGKLGPASELPADGAVTTASTAQS